MTFISARLTELICTVKRFCSANRSVEQLKKYFVTQMLVVFRLSQG